MIYIISNQSNSAKFSLSTPFPVAYIPTMVPTIHPTISGFQDGRQVVRLVQVTADFDLQPYMPGFTSKTNREVIAETSHSCTFRILRHECHLTSHRYVYFLLPSCQKGDKPILFLLRIRFHWLNILC